MDDADFIIAYVFNETGQLLGNTPMLAGAVVRLLIEKVEKVEALTKRIAVLEAKL